MLRSREIRHIPRTPTEEEMQKHLIDSVPLKLTKHAAQENYIEYCAAAGLVVTPDGKIELLSIEKYADQIGWSRATLYNWQRSVPDFWKKVNDRRMTLYAGARTQLVWRGVFLRAAKGDAKQAEMILRHYSDYLPSLKQNSEKNNHDFASIVSTALKEGIIDI